MGTFRFSSEERLVKLVEYIWYSVNEVAAP
jgi:hypothetical protein